MSALEKLELGEETEVKVAEVVFSEAKVFQIIEMSHLFEDSAWDLLSSEEVVEVELPELGSLGETSEEELEPVVAVVGEVVSLLPVDDLFEDGAVHGERLGLLVEHHELAVELGVRDEREDEAGDELVRQSREYMVVGFLLFFHLISFNLLETGVRRLITLEALRGGGGGGGGGELKL